MNWNYQQAFCRNLGLFNPEEQQILKSSRVAICGMGGVGGIHAITLARMGIGAFTIADFDHFEVANFNRQYGAMVQHLGQPKTEVMAHYLRQINPEVDIRIFNEAITPQSCKEFLKGAHVFLDGIDAFMVDIREHLFQMAYEQKIFAISAGPFGFSTGWVIFDPEKMSFKEYLGLSPNLSEEEKFYAFVVGMAPSGLHIPYIDMKYVNVDSHQAPSVASACQLASGVVATEIVKILLKRGKIYSAPWYHQFDPFQNNLKLGYLWGGGKNPIFYIKRKILKYLVHKGRKNK